MATKDSKEKNFSNFMNNKFDYVLVITILLLLALGVVMVLSASAPSSLSQNGSSYTFFIKQFIFAIIGLIAMMFISKIDYRVYKKYYWLVYVVSVVILLLVLVPGLGRQVNGATRWISIFGIQFQPSELTKIGLIVFYAGYLTDHKKELGDFWRGFIKPLIFLAVPCLILYKVQNHLSVDLVLGMVSIVMMITAGVRMLYFVGTGAVGAAGGLILFLKGTLLGSDSASASFRLDRIKVFFDPWSDATGTGYQMIQSLYAIGSGGLFGVGLGNSKQKYLYIPEPQNDFIFAIVAEELGFIGCLVVIALFAIFTWRGILISMKSNDMFGSLLAVGITTLVAFQAIVNIAVVTASIPTTGMPLPFFSYGGTALSILLAACGVLLNISRSTSKS